MLPWPVVTRNHMIPKFLMVPDGSQRGKDLIYFLLNLEEDASFRVWPDFSAGHALDSLVR